MSDVIAWYATSIAGGLLGAFLWQGGALLWRRLQTRQEAATERKEKRVAARMAFVNAVDRITNYAPGPPEPAGEVGPYPARETKARRKAWPSK